MEALTNLDVDNELITIAKQLISESGTSYQRDVRIDDALQQRLGIDSLTRAELFHRIEKNFAVTIPDRLLVDAKTLRDIANYLYTATPQENRIIQQKTINAIEQSIKVDPEEAKTLIDVLLLYGKKAPHKAHVYFQTEDGGELVITYGELLQNSLRVAQGLINLGLKERETVAIMQPTQPEFFYIFYGILLAGGIPVPIYPPFRMHMLEKYAQTEARILSNAEVRILVTFEQAEKLSRLLKSFVPSLKHVVTPDDLLNAQPLEQPFIANPDDFAFIQYTSGSTADPKGVLLTHANLIANISTYGKTIQVKPEDVAVSWLPLYHDMGLIGMWLGSLYFGVPLVLMTPFSFLNHPERWLWAIHHYRGTLSGGPNFAYELCIHKVDENLLEGLDLSSLRIAANGAEKVYPRTLEQFSQKFARYGLKDTALLPVYGLAESTVALTIPPLKRHYVIDYVDRKEFEQNRHAVTSKDKDALSFASCGYPIEGHDIKIVDEGGNTLPDRYIGSLYFRGPSNMQGYFNNPNATRAIYHDGWLDSGDLAYIADGEIYLTGRRKDLIIKAGRNIYPAEIEEIVGSIEHVRIGCVAAFAIDTEHTHEKLVVVAETKLKDKTQQAELIQAIKTNLATALDVVPDDVVLVSPHVVPKTSSGKLQRAACKNMYINNLLGQYKIPAWLQISRLTAVSLLRTLGKFAKKTLAVIYTVYLMSILLITIMPFYLSVRFGSLRTAQKAAQIWARTVIRLSFCPVKYNGLEKLSTTKPTIYCVNHSSYIDPLLLLSCLPLNTKYVAKKEVFSVPILRTILKKLNCIPVNRADLTKGLEETQQIQQAVSTGSSVVIFPEGTFAYGVGLRPFRLGAFKAAAEMNVGICPVTLKGTRYILRGEERVFHPGRIEVTISNPVQPMGKAWKALTDLRNVVRAEIAKYCGEPTLDFIAAQSVAPVGNQNLR